MPDAAADPALNLAATAIDGVLPAVLPDDPAALKALLKAQQAAFAAELARQRAEQAETLQAQRAADQRAFDAQRAEQEKAFEAQRAEQQKAFEARILELYEKIRLARQRLFGRASEAHAGQGWLFNEAEALLEAASEASEAAPLPAAAATEAGKEARPPRPRGKRAPLPAELPRIEVIHALPEAERMCACGTPMVEIGEEVSEQLDIVPMQVRVLRHIRKRYACPKEDAAPASAPVPAQVLPKSNASNDLLAMLLTTKYVDGLPLARFEYVLGRAGVAVPRQTLARWTIGTAEALQPNAKLLLLFDYDPSRAQAVPLRLLEGWKGYLMADGLESYGAIALKDGVTRLGCWVHARRRFVEAARLMPAGKTGRAHEALAFIGKLYGIEKDCRDLSAAERGAIRHSRSRAVCEALRRWLDEALATVPPSTALGQALGYLHNQWPRLVRYVERGDLPIDNNPAENAIRPFVVGRKAWLFADTQAGAHASALIYSLVETAKANGLEPYLWLRNVLRELPAATTVEHFDALLPWNQKQAILPTA